MLPAEVMLHAMQKLIVNGFSSNAGGIAGENCDRDRSGDDRQCEDGDGEKFFHILLWFIWFCLNFGALHQV